MNPKRIIPCLDIQNGRVVKGVNFTALRDAGDPVEIARAYEAQGADELAFLDIAATTENRGTIVELARTVARAISIPLTVGGGIRNLADIQKILDAGAQKVSLNTAAILNPLLLYYPARQFGRERLMVAIDAASKADGQSGWTVLTHGGGQRSSWDVVAWAKEAERLGAGEVLLTSKDCDGALSGYDLPLTRAVADAVSVPVIASGGVGRLEHFLQGIVEGHADAVLAASVFHFGTFTIPQVKDYLASHGVPVHSRPAAADGPSPQEVTQ